MTQSPTVPDPQYTPPMLRLEQQWIFPFYAQDSKVYRISAIDGEQLTLTDDAGQHLPISESQLRLDGRICAVTGNR